MPDFHVTFRDLLHAVNLRHGINGFTSLPKEGVLRIFFSLKNPRLRPGLNPRTCLPKASALPLDHRSRYDQCKYHVSLCFLQILYSWHCVKFMYTNNNVYYIINKNEYFVYNVKC